MWNYLRNNVKYFDIVHIHAVFLWPTWAAAKEASHKNIPYVISPRGMLVPELIERKSRVKKMLSIRLFDHRVLKNAKMIHFTTERERSDFLRLGLPVSRAIVIPNGIELSEILPERASVSGRGKQRILYLGRLNWKKGLMPLMEAMAGINGAELIMAGENEDGYRAELEQFIEKRGFHERIRVEEPRYGSEKWGLIVSASLLVLPSISENFGNVVLEAMAVGVPVVVTEGVGVSSLVESSGAGLVCDASPKGIADAISCILDDAELASQMGRNGRAVVAEHYDWRVISQRMEAMYYSLLEPA